MIWCKPFIVFLLAYTMCIRKAETSILVSETFQSCGIFIKDSQPISSKQGDIIHSIIDHLRLKQRISSPLIVKNKQSKRELHPNIFRSMKYDCYLYVHVNFGKDLFSTIPSFKNPLLSALYQKALFLIIVKRNPHDMFTGASWKLQLERQSKIFVLRFQINFLFHRRPNENPLNFLRKYFFCTFCNEGLVELVQENIFSLNLLSFEKNWIHEFAEHYYFIKDENELANEEKCRKSDVMALYDDDNKCQNSQMLARMVIYASGCNFTLKLRRDYDSLEIPQVFVDSHDTKFEAYKYSSPILSHYKYPSIIYCFNLERESVAQTNMWTKYVPLETWSLVGLCLLLLSILNAAKGSLQNRKSVECTVQNFFLLVNSMVKILGILSRQSWSHKWKLFGLVEIMFGTLILVYENSITAGVVVPSVPEPYKNTRELYNENYTFVVKQNSFVGTSRYNRWLSDEYDTKNHPKVVGVSSLARINTWLKRYFLEPYGGDKYAIVGDLSKNYHFRAVTFVKEKTTLVIKCFQRKLRLRLSLFITSLDPLWHLRCRKEPCFFKLLGLRALSNLP